MNIFEHINHLLKTYLSQYGYLKPSMKNSNVANIISEEAMVKAIREFQSFFGLNLTGRLDNDTLHLMSKPRCGNQDVGEFVPTRTRRYISHNRKWEINDLTYNIIKYPKQLDKSVIDSEIRRAFDLWSEVTPLRFTHKKSGKVNINIRFEEGKHGDRNSSYTVLSHTFNSKYVSDIYFDGSIKWSVNSKEGTNLFQRVVHELGHSLGLFHSKKESSVMFVIDRGYNPNFTLSSDDVEAIQAIYGSNNKTEKVNLEKDHDVLKNN
ncbi:stromelysin-2-like isoform X2 [Sipha flava]|uniref:Stromelysin-2-like isoform X2 n=1 Tax=Sipha flava TaxID=143950 RepID=A0A8B8FTR1_9HEMI|nr:stromelysin-2-like isoform X2 [Sipha flava]